MASQMPKMGTGQDSILLQVNRRLAIIPQKENNCSYKYFENHYKNRDALIDSQIYYNKTTQIEHS